MSNLGECEVEWVLLSSPTFDQKNRVGSTNQRIADTLDWAEKWTTKNGRNQIQFYFLRREENIFFFLNQLIFESRYISGPDWLSNTKTNLPVYRTEKQRWKEIKHKLKRTLRDLISNILLEQLLRTRQMESFIMQRENQMVLHALSR